MYGDAAVFFWLQRHSSGGKVRLLVNLVLYFRACGSRVSFFLRRVATTPSPCLKQELDCGAATCGLLRAQDLSGTARETLRGCAQIFQLSTTRSCANVAVVMGTRWCGLCFGCSPPWHSYTRASGAVICSGLVVLITVQRRHPYVHLPESLNSCFV